MTDTRARLLELAATFRRMPLLERDAKRLPIVAQMIGSVGRRLFAAGDAGRELRAAYDRGASSEELEAMVRAHLERDADAGRELEALIASWPDRDPPTPAPDRRRVVQVRLLPRSSSSSSSSRKGPGKR